jgi:glycosyltransferase involved in cell wall biosynthesis
LLSDAPALRKDRTALLWTVKRLVYERSRITLVAPSRWMAKIAAESPLLSRFPVHVIPNGLDMEIFRPIPQPVAREMFGIPPAGCVVLFAAVDAEAARKGGRLLQEAVARLAPGDPAPFRLMVVGAGSEQWQSRVRVPVTAIPTIADDRLLAAAYSAADLFVMPTLAENLPNAVLESMACGTPTVAFDVGGVSDAVRHGETGWLARAGDAADLARLIGEALCDDERREQMGRRGRAVAESEYPSALQTDRFVSLYQDLVDRRPRRATPIAAAGAA